MLPFLNPEFDQVRVQLLRKEEVPCLSEVMALVMAKESKQGFMLEPGILRVPPCL